MLTCDAPHTDNRLTPRSSGARARAVRAAALTTAVALAVAACAPATSRASTAPVPAPVPARADSGSSLLEPMLTRSDLQGLAARLDSVARFGADEATRSRARADAVIAQRRLQLGDFQAGDRFFLSISGGVVLTDTVTVLNGPSVSIKDVAVIPLTGVLRSELRDYLGQQVLRYVRNATVDAQPLINVGMLGAIAKPGFYSFPAGLSLADAVMRAGGPITGSTDLDKTEVRRGDAVIMDSRRVRSALSSGISFDRMNLRSGDQIQFGEKKNISYLTVVQAAAGLISVIAVAYYGFRRR